MNEQWKTAQKWEQEWHGNCVNSINEELKQFVYMKRMGMKFTPNAKTPYEIDLEGKSILDIGGGAYSLLLKSVNFSRGVVVEPIEHPEWVLKRYEAHNVEFVNKPAEELDNLSEDVKFDEVWMYNVLQHTMNPEKIIKNARKLGKLIRIFEWIDTPVNIGHIHTLRAEKLDLWLGGEGKATDINEMGCKGRCYYGVFPCK